MQSMLSPTTQLNVLLTLPIAHQVESDHAAWMNKHKSASDAELRHQADMMARERTHLAELQRIEEEISRQRLATLTSLESAAKDEMDLMDRVSVVLCYYCLCLLFHRSARHSGMVKLHSLNTLTSCACCLHACRLPRRPRSCWRRESCT
jgi:hypothetical protein